MDLNTAEKFLLIILHPEKSKYLISDQMLAPGLFGSIFADLTMDGKIEIIDKKVVTRSSYTKLSEAHRLLLGKLAASRRRKRVKAWLVDLAWSGRKYRHIILHDLAMKGMIKLEDKQFLFFKYKRACLFNRNVRKSILEEVKEAILRSKVVDDEIASLLGIIAACKMHKIITKDKTELKTMKSNLEEMVKQDSISKEVHQVIMEMQAATTVAIITSSG